jgi:hypothetical protein
MYHVPTFKPVSEDEDYFTQTPSLDPLANYLQDTFLEQNWAEGLDSSEQKLDFTQSTPSSDTPLFEWENEQGIKLPRQEFMRSDASLETEEDLKLQVTLSEKKLGLNAKMYTDDDLQQEINVLKRQLQRLNECNHKSDKPKKAKTYHQDALLNQPPIPLSKHNKQVPCHPLDTKKLKDLFQDTHALKAYMYKMYPNQIKTKSLVSMLRELKNEFIKLYTLNPVEPYRLTAEENKVYSLLLYKLKKESGTIASCHSNEGRYSCRQLFACERKRVKGRFVGAKSTVEEPLAYPSPFHNSQEDYVKMYAYMVQMNQFLLGSPWGEEIASSVPLASVP